MAACAQARSGRENVEAVQARRRQSRAPRREPAEIRPAGGGRRSTTSPPTPKPSSPRSRDAMAALGVEAISCTHWARWRRGRGGAGARGDRAGSTAARRAYKPLYPLRPEAGRQDPHHRARDLPRRRTSPCRTRWRGGSKAFEDAGFGDVPVCIAKTQYSFTADPTVMGAPDGPRPAGARGAAVRRRRLRGGDLRRHHDHARPAARARGGGDPLARGWRRGGLVLMTLDGVKALAFDVFGTVVDWRSGVAREAAPFLARHGKPRCGSGPLRRRLARPLPAGDGGGAQRARARSRARRAAPGEPRRAAAAIRHPSRRVRRPSSTSSTCAWHRLDPWPDAVAGLTRLKHALRHRDALERQRRADGRHGEARRPAVGRDPRRGGRAGLQAEPAGLSAHRGRAGHEARGGLHGRRA